MVKSLAGRGQMFFGIFETSHFFKEQGSKLSAVGIVYLDLGAPLADMIARLGCHPACHSGHEPRVAVLRVLFGDLLAGMEAIVSLAQSVFEVVARAEGLGT